MMPKADDESSLGDAEKGAESSSSIANIDSLKANEVVSKTTRMSSRKLLGRVTILSVSVMNVKSAFPLRKNSPFVNLACGDWAGE
jgi:hypothetical protein